MSIAKRVWVGVVLAAALSSTALAANGNGTGNNGVQPQRTSLHPATFSARNVALRYAQQHFGRLGRVTLARSPLLKAQDGTMQTQAYGISINGRRRSEAVIVRGGGITGFFQGVGLADVHNVKTPRGSKSVELPTTMHDAVILRVKGAGSDIKGTQNLAQMAKGLHRGTLSAAYTPVFPEGSVRPFVFPGPSGNTVGKAKVTHGKSTTTLTKGFSRFVIMDAGSNPMQPQ